MNVYPDNEPIYVGVADTQLIITCVGIPAYMQGARALSQIKLNSQLTHLCIMAMFWKWY